MIHVIFVFRFDFSFIPVIAYYITFRDNTIKKNYCTTLIIAVFKMVEIDVDHATQKTHNKNTNDRQSRDIWPIKCAIFLYIILNSCSFLWFFHKNFNKLHTKQINRVIKEFDYTVLSQISVLYLPTKYSFFIKFN